MFETIVWIVVSFVVGLFAGKPIWQKVMLTGKGTAELFLAFWEATREESEKGRELSEAERERIKKKFLDLVDVWRKK